MLELFAALALGRLSLDLQIYNVEYPQNQNVRQMRRLR